MNAGKRVMAACAITLPIGLAVVVPSVGASSRPAQTSVNAQAAAAGDGQFVAVAASDADYAGLKADVEAAGGRVVRELPAVATLVVKAPKAAKARMAASVHAAGVASDHIESIEPPDGSTTRSPQHRVVQVNAAHSAPSVIPDPASSIPGLLWNQQRVKMTEAWKVTAGDPAVTVGVADTGLDYTHSELAPKVVHVEDFTGSEDPPICKTFVAAPNNKSDADWAAEFGGPANTDWNGHGSWIGGNIAAALDGVGINGIAPKVNLVALKISQWCGSAYDSEILAAFVYAADHGINIVSISFGGYLDKSDPDQALILKQYQQVVKYANEKGTTIIAAAGNEHLRINGNGKVVSHGPLTTPGTAPADFVDHFGLYEVPGGIPGTVNVASTGNMVNGSSASCPAPTPGDTNFTCKPASDAHQPSGVGKPDQLAYYSNFGPGIDVAAPGGARKFNLPVWDTGGTPGWPYTTADGFTAWEDFSITSNWALQIPCFVINGGGFYPNECYSTIQGTSMATPHASAVAALIASAQPQLAHNPTALVHQLTKTARKVQGNTTPGLSATDLAPGDSSGVACPTGYCHLGGPAISDKDAYGAGIVNAAAAVKR
jgi:subtilisin family serine protease